MLNRHYRLPEILYWYACGADGRSLDRSLARSVYDHVITKFSRMGRLPHCLSYGAPPTRGASRRAWSSAIKQQVRDIGSKFLNNVEISAQEAVYLVLQLPMRKSSRQIIFINTSPPNERVELLKPMDDIKNMEDDSEEIYTSGLLNRYCKRSQKLENLTLADWAA